MYLGRKREGSEIGDVASSRRRKMESFENISPQIITRITREIKELERDPPEGIRRKENPFAENESIMEVFVEIDGPEETPYEGGTFLVKLVLSPDFPASPPRGFFLTKIFHPNISPTGDICVNTLKKDWDRNMTLKHVLQVIRCLLIIPFPESALNDEAGKLFMESYGEYHRRAKTMTSVYARRNREDDKEPEKTEVRKESVSSDDAILDIVADKMRPLNEMSNTILKAGGNDEEEGKKCRARLHDGSRTARPKDKSKENRKKGLKRL